MSTTRVITSRIGLIVAMIVFPSVALGQSGGTLVRWGIDPTAEGGPDLSEPLVTDRPDFTEASVTVGRGVAQLEMGYTYIYDSNGGSSTRAHSYPETLLRVGMLADWFELRVDWNYAEERVNDFGGEINTDSGAEDLGIGCKLALTPQECMFPETALLLQMSVPSGSNEFTADEVLPGVSYLYGWDINECWSTGGSSVFNRAVDDATGDDYFEFAQSWTIGRSWTDEIGSYTEWFAFIPSGADTNPTEHYFNGGFTYLINDNVQWDVRAGVGLNGAADDYFVGSGLAIRFR
jgi:Putative MetA-pathway of phenol degradation